MIKALKRKVSRIQLEAPDPSQLGGAAGVDNKTPSSSAAAANTNTVGSPPKSFSHHHHATPQYRYQRPDLFEDFSEEELVSFANHVQRPVVTPRKALPRDVGYAEVINAGKSKWNEDQATVSEGELVGINGVVIPYLYIGLFDGHGGPDTAIKVAKELHGILHEGLEDVLPYMVNKEKLLDEEQDKGGNESKSRTMSEEEEEEDDDDDESVELKMTIDELICGALESSFWAMDRLILHDKATSGHRISGGTTAIVALFICGKLYVANAGDSRAGIVSQGSVEQLRMKQMSFDFTPGADRQRIQHVAFQRPELLRHPHTRDKLFNRHMLSRKVTKEDVGISIMYRDYYMTGWSCKEVTSDDVNLIPIISGRGKQCRLLSTVGVARSLGDHDLLAKGCGIRVKEFLTPEPEVRVHSLKGQIDSQVLVMGTDGLWDVLSNEDVTADVLRMHDQTPAEVARFLVTRARGERIPDSYWEMHDGRLASGDDITAIVVNLQKARGYECIKASSPMVNDESVVEAKRTRLFKTR